MGSTRTRWSQYIPYRTDEERDWLLRALWRQQSDLCEIVEELTPIAVVKG